ncbi:P-loop containing nucleoside triphosphate hydrolase protein [Aspergillus egyptiacus]|nr:P-loop containing nucleoside triphosphate hydrolase protein [Aspergillus egyptiacus]
MLLLGQSASLLACHPTTRFQIAWRAGLSGVIILLVIILQNGWTFIHGDTEPSLAILIGAEAGAAFLYALLSFSIPPDRQNTASFLSWISFSWMENVLRRIEHAESSTVDHLPELDHTTRGDSLYQRCPWALWHTVLRSQCPALICQAIITTLQSVLGFVPQLALLRILTLLEARQRGESRDSPWGSVVGLGLSLVASATLETFNGGFGSDMSENDESQEDGQDPINMAAVDVKNVADLFCFFFLIYESPIKLGLASTFLTYLLGWQSLLAGLAAMSLLLLFNMVAGWKYSHWQRTLMSFRDNRQQAITEMLRGIRQVKFSANEHRWEDKINGLRNTELQAQWTVRLWQIAFVSMYSAAPVLLSATCLSVYVLLSGHLTASTAFTSISVLASIEVAMTILPDVIALFLNAQVSMQRIQSFLSQPAHTSDVMPSSDITFQNATVAWPGCHDGRGVLAHLNLRFPRQELSIITGPTGSGKSLLLATILGETDILEGVVSAPISVPFGEISHPPTTESWLTESAVAFVPQWPWLRNTTIRENILFGLPLNGKRYAEVVFACALTEDFESFPHADQTEISSDGANLSGGQRWRVCLARALYSRAQTLLLDDIFSALDVHTREHVYQHALCGEPLRGRTCILATHHLDLCTPQAKYLVRLQDGALKSAVSLGGSQSVRLPMAVDVHAGKPKSSFDEGRKPSARSASSAGSGKAVAIAQESAGGMSNAVYVFLQEGGSMLRWGCLAAAFVLYGACMLGRSWWLHIWVDQYEEKDTSSTTVSRSDVSGQGGLDSSVVYYVSVYLIISALACTLGACRSYFSLSAALRASQQLFRKMLWAVVRAPLQWHDTVSLGSVVSRFSADLNILDVRVGDDLRATLEYSMDVLMAVAAGAMVNPLLLIISALLIGVYVRYARRFIPVSRQLKALENEAKGPILEHMNNTRSGLTTVRAFGQAQIASDEFKDAVSRHARAFWHLWLLNRWLGFRINIIGAAFSAGSAMLMACLSDVSPSMAGFAISFTIDVSLTMALSLRRYVNLEQGMDSVARVHEYSVIPTEGEDLDEDSIEPGRTQLRTWPQRGKLEVSQLVVRHAAHLPPVLEDVSFTVSPNTRVGIVGRTGAGKSSLVLALFRFLEPSMGRILIDDVDISQVPLTTLRRRLAIIPQRPVLFRGTVRSNLDPFDEYDDSILLTTLRAVGWREDMASACPDAEAASSVPGIPPIPEGEEASRVESDHRRLNRGMNCPENPLDQAIQEDGENLSQGQQQLLCLARAAISKPKIAILDEATSAVDKSTDDHIQRALRLAFKASETTLIVIAHRLKTIVDSDMLLVLDSGRIVEMGSPQELFRKQDGHFRAMVERDRERDLLESLVLGSTSK